MTKVKRCADCVWGWMYHESSSNIYCSNSLVNKNNVDYLARPCNKSNTNYINTKDEREKGFFGFPACGKAGKLWVDKSIVDVTP